MRSIFEKHGLALAVGASLVALALAGLVADQRLRRQAELVESAGVALQAGVLDLLDFARLTEGFPSALGTGSEAAARVRVEAALNRLETLPARLSAQAEQARATGHEDLAEAVARVRREVEADLLALVSTTDRMIGQERRVGATAYAKRMTAVLLQRMLPELAQPHLDLHVQHTRLMRSRWLLAGQLAALSMVLVLLLAVFVISPLSRAERRALRESRAALEQATLTDPVSGLPNRDATLHFLESLPPEQAVLITMFEIAPAFGLPDGDQTEIAIGVAASVGRRLRELDIDVLFMGQARRGRYCIVQPAIEHDQDGFSPQRDLESLADEPVQLGHLRVRLAFRAGVAMRRPHRPAAAALDNASIALDKALELRALQPIGYRPEFRRETIANRRLAQELRVALMSGEVRPYFQPQIDLRSGAVVGMEALARWYHPRRGVLPPRAFLPQAQRTGLDEPLGEVMLRLGLEALRDWDERGLEVGTVGINAAGSQLNNPRYVDLVRWELDRQRIAPDRLAIEVLENIHAPSDDDPIARNVRRLARLGVRIDMDDFGTGATSVMGMRRYHATRIKIDRSYIRDIDSTASNQTMVSTMVQMARNLEIDSLAEGVETAAERAWLAHVGCDHIQGFGVARPMPLEETFDWLARHQAVRPRASGGQG